MTRDRTTKVWRQAPVLGLCLILVAVSAMGCADLEQRVRKNPKTAIGAATGAAGGILLGGLIFRSTTGAVIGGLLGGLAGGVIGDAMESRKQEYRETANALNYTSSQGTLVRTDQVEAQPSTVGPGDTVHLITHYALLTPDPTQEVSVTERREITRGRQKVGNPVLTVQRRGGTWASTIPLTLPTNAAPGVYRVNVSVQADGSLDKKATNFTVK